MSGETGRARTASILFARRLRAPSAARSSTVRSWGPYSLPAGSGSPDDSPSPRPSVVTLVTWLLRVSRTHPQNLRRSRARPHGAGWAEDGGGRGEVSASAAIECREVRAGWADAGPRRARTRYRSAAALDERFPVIPVASKVEQLRGQLTTVRVVPVAKHLRLLKRNKAAGLSHQLLKLG